MLPWYLQKVALVEWRPGAGAEAIARLAGRQGLTGGASVQLAAELAFARDVITRGALVCAMRFDADGEFVGEELVTEDGWKAIEDSGETPIVRVGDAAPRPRPVGAGLPEDWAELLAFAIDGVLIGISKTRVGEPPLGEGVILPAIPVLIGVSGAALAVIGSVAAWRFFDPDLQARTTAITAAADSYAARLGALEATGTLPPPSPIELGAVEVVKETAEDRKGDAWLVGGGILGGFTVGVAGLAAARRAWA